LHILGQANLTPCSLKRVLMNGALLPGAIADGATITAVPV
jgi:hypothetical protein